MIDQKRVRVSEELSYIELTHDGKPLATLQDGADDFLIDPYEGSDVLFGQSIADIEAGRRELLKQHGITVDSVRMIDEMPVRSCDRPGNL